MINYIIREGKNTMNAERTPLFYKQITHVQAIDMEQVCEDISHACTLTRDDAKGMLSALQNVLVRHLRNGYSIRLGDLGSFRPTIQCKSAASEEELEKIKDIRLMVRFTPSALMKRNLKVENNSITALNPLKSKNGGSTEDGI